MDRKEYRELFAKNLKKYLKARGMTQRELSIRLGVSEGNVSDWMSCKSSPRINVVDNICAILNITRSDLMDEYTDKIEMVVTNEEEELINLYRSVSPDQRKIVLSMIRAAINS